MTTTNRPLATPTHARACVCMHFEIHIICALLLLPAASSAVRSAIAKFEIENLWLVVDTTTSGRASWRCRGPSRKLYS